MRSKERLLEVLKSVNSSFLDHEHFKVILAAVSALETAPVDSIAWCIEDRIPDFGSPHIRELLTEAVAHIKPMGITS